MDRAHVTLDNGQEADVLVRSFTVKQGLDSEAEVNIEGFLTRLAKQKPQATELGVPIEHFNCKCAPTRTCLTVKRVIYNDPATVVYWSDKTRTVVKCQPGDAFDPKIGFLLALCKKVCGNTGKYNDLLREAIPGYGSEKIQTEPSIEQMRKELANFCHESRCESCPMNKDGFECGRGKFFTNSLFELGYMTDKSIVKHYRAMKGALKK